MYFFVGEESLQGRHSRGLRRALAGVEEEGIALVGGLGGGAGKVTNRFRRYGQLWQMR